MEHKQIPMKKAVFVESLLMQERNDCTVRALALALEVPYLTAYGMTLAVGRKKNHGCRCDLILDKLAVAQINNPGCSVKTLVERSIIWGHWIVWIRGHVFAVINGVIHDSEPNASLGCHVIRAWRLR